MRALSVLVGKMVSSLALAYVRYLNCLKCRFGLTETIWDFRLNYQQYFQPRTWRKKLKSQNISFKHFSTESFFLVFPQSTVFLNLAQLSKGKRKWHPKPAFEVPSSPLSPLKQKVLASHLTHTVCSILPVALQSPTMTDAKTTLWLPVLLMTYFSMKQRLKANQAKPEPPFLQSSLGWTGELC